MRAATFFILVSLAPLSSTSASDSARAATIDEASGGNSLLQPGLCRPLLELPQRVTDSWDAVDAARATAAAAETAAVIDEESSVIVDETVTATIEAPSPADDPLATDPAPPRAAPAKPLASEDFPVQLEADQVELRREGESELQGNVWLQQGERFLSTDHMVFDESTGVIETLAPARFGSRQLVIDSEHAIYNMNIGQGEFEDVDFWLVERNARGEAASLARTGDATARIESVKYTSCPPEDEDWWLKASSMDLDQDEGIGTARNVRIAFMGVPFFYTPWLSFPIDERRKTGFLFPEFGTSGRVGTWLRVPYYLNLDPQYDAVLAPYYMSERGTMLESQFRYLFRWGTGAVNADYLGNDRQTNTERYYYRLDHSSRLGHGWSANVVYRQVSDDEYFQDLSGRSSLVYFLDQTAVVRRNDLEWGAALSVKRYQTVDPTIPESEQPYETWPKLSYYYSPLPVDDWLWLSVDGTSVNFQRDDRLSGWRHHTQTAFSTDIGSAGLYATPRVAWWHTEYDMNQATGEPLEISRALPVSSLDLQARFERSLASGNGRQTLEPRLYYLYIPYREQEGIPRFDTRNTTDTLASLFRENRFTGPDRVGDENRVSVSITSALSGPDGREWFSAAIARAWHLDEREVQLTAKGTPDETTASNYYAALEYLPTQAQRVTLDANWHPDDEKVDAGALAYQFRPDYGTVFQTAYRYRRFSSSVLEQVDAAFATPIASRWRIFGRVVYSLEEERSQETLAGFEYESCCWIFRTFNRRHIFNRDGEFDQSLWFQLELKGLSSVGRRIDDFLLQDIYGYGETE